MTRRCVRLGVSRPRSRELAPSQADWLELASFLAAASRRLPGHDLASTPGSFVRFDAAQRKGNREGGQSFHGHVFAHLAYRAFAFAIRASATGRIRDRVISSRESRGRVTSVESSFLSKIVRKFSRIVGETFLLPRLVSRSVAFAIVYCRSVSAGVARSSRFTLSQDFRFESVE